MTQHTMFSPSFVRTAVGGVRAAPRRMGPAPPALTCAAPAGMGRCAAQFFRWFDELLENSWLACKVRRCRRRCRRAPWFDGGRTCSGPRWRPTPRGQGSDLIIATPYCFSGFHVAEALGPCRVDLRA